MDPKITFDDSSSHFIIEALGKTIDKDGYIKDPDTKSGLKEKCGICKKDIHIKHFAGVINKIGFICNNTSCLVDISNHIKV
jgi:hypothetical protein